VKHLSLDRTPSGREVTLVWLGLAVLTALAFIPHIRHGGFYLDDWSNAAGALHPPGGDGAGNALSYFADLTIYRPVLVVYVPLTYFVFGMNMALHLTWAAVLAVVVAGLLYGILRTLGVPWIHAGLISALTIVYPWFDSTRLWATADQVTLAVAFALAGLWIALAGLSRGRPKWHIGAAILYLLSILTYEVALPLIAAAGILYTLRGGWRAARLRWAADLIVVVIGGAWVGTHTQRTTSSLGGDLTHLKQIVDAGGTLLGRTLLPLGDQRTTLALACIALALLVGLAARLLLSERAGEDNGWGLAGWLYLTVAGLAVAGLGWFMFIPADPYYTPSIYGMTNRVNGLAGIGLIVAVYGSFGIVGALIAQTRSGLARAGLAVTLALGVVLGIAYVDVLRRHSTIWDAAFVAERSGLTELKSRFPSLPKETTVFVAGYPANQTLGVTIFGASWDVDGMVKTEYDDGTLWAYPVLPGLELACLDDGVSLTGTGAPERTAPYGTVLLIDLGSDHHAKPPDRKACQKAAGSYVPGPLYLSIAY
jgi:hypothetical protein